MTNLLRVCESGLENRTRATRLWWECVTDHLIKVSKWTKSSLSSLKKSPDHSPLFLRDTPWHILGGQHSWTPVIQEVSGGCWEQLLNTSARWANQDWSFPVPLLTKKEELIRDEINRESHICSSQGIRRYKMLTGVRKASSTVQTLGIWRADFSFSGNW